MGLDQWINIATDAAVAITEAEEAEMTQAEISRLQVDMTALRGQIEDSRQRTGTLIELTQTLNDNKAELTNASQELALQKMNEKAARDEAILVLTKYVDLEKISEAHRIMSKNHSIKKSYAHTEFDNAQNTVLIEHQRLRAAGFNSEGLYALASANFNRCDRDDVSKITESMFLDIKPIVCETEE